MLTIGDDQVGHCLSDKFVTLCHVDYFINSDKQKSMTGYIYCTFYIFIFRKQIYTFKDKNDYLSFLYYFLVSRLGVWDPLAHVGSTGSMSLREDMSLIKLQFLFFYNFKFIILVFYF